MIETIEIEETTTSNVDDDLAHWCCVHPGDESCEVDSENCRSYCGQDLSGSHVVDYIPAETCIVCDMMYQGDREL